MSKKVITTCYEPSLHGAPPASGSPNAHPFVYKLVSANSSVTVSGAAWRLALTNDSEAQSASMYLRDVLAFDIDDIKRVRIWAALPVAPGATAKARFGLASTQNADPDVIAASVFWGLNGSAMAATAKKLKIECDDGTNEVAATETGFSLDTAVKKFSFDFAGGLHAQQAPDLNVGGKANIIAKVDNDWGEHQTVFLASTRLNMSAYTAGLQPLIQIQKTSSTDVGTIDIYRIEIDHTVAG